MSKLLSGSDLALYIKERHRRTAPVLDPGLAILYAGQDEPTAVYVAAKERYGRDIGARVSAKACASLEEMAAEIARLNTDHDTQGIVIQLPLPDGWDADSLIERIEPAKDIDGLGTDSPYDPATPTGIMWLLSGYNIDVKGKQVAVVGQGRLVGRPLAKLLEGAGAEVVVCDEHTKDLAAKTRSAEIIVTATGVPGLITSDMVGDKAVVIDAGTALRDGKLVGDCASELYERPDIKITPTPGGVGPMTVAALFDHLLRAAQAK